MVMLHIKLNGITKCSNMVANILSADPSPDPRDQKVIIQLFQNNVGAQWLSGRVFDSRLRGSGFEPHRRHCVVILEQDTFMLA